MTEEFNLAKLKEKYHLLQLKYSLPSFEDMNEEFQIEKIAELETEFILREIRKYVVDKFFGYLRFLESIITPNNVPMFVFAIVKTLGIKEREKAIDLYKRISNIEIEVLELDLNYSESTEAETIKKYFTLWKNMKKELNELVLFIRKNWDNKSEDNGKGYFG